LAAINCFVTALCPYWAAIVSGVEPLVLAWLTSAQAATTAMLYVLVYF
jgi:hypothetical protein